MHWGLFLWLGFICLAEADELVGCNCCAEYSVCVGGLTSRLPYSHDDSEGWLWVLDQCCCYTDDGMVWHCEGGGKQCSHVCKTFHGILLPNINCECVCMESENDCRSVC